MTAQTLPNYSANPIYGCHESKESHPFLFTDGAWHTLGAQQILSQKRNEWMRLRFGGFLLGSYCLGYCSYTAACISHHPLTQNFPLIIFCSWLSYLLIAQRGVINQNGQWPSKERKVSGLKKWYDQGRKRGSGGSKPSQLPILHLKTCQ